MYMNQLNVKDKFFTHVYCSALLIQPIADDEDAIVASQIAAFENLQYNLKWFLTFGSLYAELVSVGIH